MKQRAYAAFLRGISPMNAKMSELREVFGSAGFSDVKTVLTSGNLVFAASTRSAHVVERTAEAAMREHLGKSFLTIARPIDDLVALLEADPFRRFRLSPEAKRIVSFFRRGPAEKTRLPPEREGARILSVTGGEAFSVYVPSPRGAVFMSILERTFGKEITTRTWDTVKKVVAAAQR